jgi:hypothetical protein
MTAKCPYCARPLRMGGLRCRACRRFVLRRVHILLLILLGIAAVIGLFEIAERLAQTPMLSF